MKYFLSILFLFSIRANANPSVADIQKLVDKVKKGEKFDDYHSFNSQMYSVHVGDSWYKIDIKSKQCFFQTMTGVTLFPCKNIKQGYPEVAPLITWE